MSYIKVFDGCYLVTIEAKNISVIGSSIRDAFKAAFEELSSKA